MVRVIILLITAAVIYGGPQKAAAQSPARAPLLDAGLKATIRAMAPVGERKIPALDGRGLVVAFFASWCPPCQPEFGELNTLRRMFSRDDVNIIAINLFETHFADKNKARMKRFLRKTEPEFAVLRGKNDETVIRAFGGVDRIPTLYVYDRAGNPAYTFIHQQGASKMHVTAKEVGPAIQKFLSAPAN